MRFRARGSTHLLYTGKTNADHLHRLWPPYSSLSHRSPENQSVHRRLWWGLSKIRPSWSTILYNEFRGEPLVEVPAEGPIYTAKRLEGKRARTGASFRKKCVVCFFLTNSWQSFVRWVLVGFSCYNVQTLSWKIRPSPCTNRLEEFQRIVMASCLILPNSRYIVWDNRILYVWWVLAWNKST